MFANKISFVSGFPTTAKVTAKLQRKTGRLLLVNGSNAFAIQNPDTFQRFYTKEIDGGAYALVGEAPGIEAKVLATFGAKEAAENGYAAFVRAYAGIQVKGVSTWIKVGVGLFLGWLILGWAADTSGAQGQAMQPIAALPASPQLPFMPHAPVDPGHQYGQLQLQPAQHTAGGYQFQPKVAMPDIKAPELNCAPASN